MSNHILQRSRISRRIMLRYLLSMLGFVVALILLILLAWFVCGLRTWYEYEPLYQILKIFKSYLPFFLTLLILTGWTFITYHFITRPLRYLDEIVNASGKLITSRDEPVRLSKLMIEVEEQLNRFRLEGLQAEAMAREAEKRKNDLVIYLAHDLKTPLTSVIGYLSLLQDEPQISPELRARYTGIALDKALRLEELTNEFFDITRFNLSTLTLELEQINLSRMLEQITYEFLPVLAEKGLSWQLELEPDKPINGDPDKLQRVFDNLIRNAVNYSYPDTAITLTMRSVETSEKETAGVKPGQAPCMEVRISNRGRTIPPEKLGRIFEQFFRLDNSRSASTGGAGLGLTISREIVELHGGSIQAESADEEIAFTVLLPQS
ncbi:MAG: HAMP domain-containing histidine kinase [Muribaculum sp.]|nr:HAMP domain-containing histidine kinase [Muribaculum sp.]